MKEINDLVTVYILFYGTGKLIPGTNVCLEPLWHSRIYDNETVAHLSYLHVFFDTDYEECGLWKCSVPVSVLRKYYRDPLKLREECYEGREIEYFDKLEDDFLKHWEIFESAMYKSFDMTFWATAE